MNEKITFKFLSEQKSAFLFVNNIWAWSPFTEASECDIQVLVYKHLVISDMHTHTERERERLGDRETLPSHESHGVALQDPSF